MRPSSARLLSSTDAARARVLSRERLFEGDVQYRWSRQYDVLPDGRFLMIKNPPRGDVEVVTSWFRELAELTD